MIGWLAAGGWAHSLPVARTVPAAAALYVAHVSTALAAAVPLGARVERAAVSRWLRGCLWPVLGAAVVVAVDLALPRGSGAPGSRWPGWGGCCCSAAQRCGRCPTRRWLGSRPNSVRQQHTEGRNLDVSGHSKWATTKHKKAVIDAKRGKLFAKLIKNIEVAARTGGGDPDGNPTLYDAIQKAARTRSRSTTSTARSSAGPAPRPAAPTGRRSCTRATAPAASPCSSSASPTTATGPASEVRTAMTRNGGSMADPGSVSYLFSRKGVVIVPKRRPAARTTC